MSYTHPTAEEIAARRAQLAPFDGWNERAFCQIVAWMGIPASHLDLGSGTGAMVNCARKLGSEAYGVDLINGPEHWFITHDLTQPLELSRDAFANQTYTRETQWPALKNFNLITCLEVAEHLPLEAHETLVDHHRATPAPKAEHDRPERAADLQRRTAGTARRASHRLPTDARVARAVSRARH
jgi:hypothetical protein